MAKQTAARVSPRIAGTTRFLDIDSQTRRTEIGAMRIGTKWQKTRVNKEAKYLMFRHAFETLARVRVEFRTDSLNERSRRAILRIVAIEEGVLRKHIITADRRIRHDARLGPSTLTSSFHSASLVILALLSAAVSWPRRRSRSCCPVLRMSAHRSTESEEYRAVFSCRPEGARYHLLDFCHS